MLLAQVVEISRRIASTTKRLEKADLLASLLKQLSPEEVEITVALLSGAARQGRIGIGYATVREAMASPAENASLEILELDQVLTEIAAVKGRGAEQRRRELVSAIMNRATGPEQQFLTGLLMGEIRQGALEGIMLDALAKASGVSLDRLRRAAMMGGGAPRLRGLSLKKAKRVFINMTFNCFGRYSRCSLSPRKMWPMRLKELGEAALEYKFDGARVQVHKSGDQVAVFSRSMNDVSAAVPEVVQAVRAMPAHDLILDGEVLSLDAEGRPQPFQVSMRRFGRKLDVEA